MAPMDIDQRGSEHPLAPILEKAEEAVITKNYDKAIELYKQCLKFNHEETYGKISAPAVPQNTIASSTPSSTPDILETFKYQEQAIYAIAKLYVQTQRSDEVRSFLKDILPLFNNLPKAKTAKIVRTLIEEVTKDGGSSSPPPPPASESGVSASGVSTAASSSPTFSLGMALCQDCIAWCREEKRTFLRLRVEKQLLQLYYQHGFYQQGIQILTPLTKEVKKLDDKLLLVDTYLLESKIYFSLSNVAKSKAALTASRTNANAIHCPPLLQAEIDMQAGVLYGEERDFKTAYSYFYEAFEAFHLANEEPKAVQALQYQLLTKIMIAGQQLQPQGGAGGAAVFGGGEDLSSLSSTLSGKKNGLKYLSYDKTQAVLAVAKCHQKKSLKQFDAVLEKYKKELEGDAFLKCHISDLNATLLEQNLLKIIEPFSRVEISHIAELIGLPIPRVMSKLSEMILDKKLVGTLEQKEGVLLCFDTPPLSSSYRDALDTIKNVSHCVDSLFAKTHILSH